MAQSNTDKFNEHIENAFIKPFTFKEAKAVYDKIAMCDPAYPWSGRRADQL